MSLFAKLAGGASRQKSSADSQTSIGPGSWQAALTKHDGPANVLLGGPHPLIPAQLSKGSVCRVRYGEGKSFLIFVTGETVKSNPTPQLSLPSRLWEALSIPKDVKEVSIDDVSGADMAPLTVPELVISISDRYVSKRDLWVFQIRLLGTVVYKGLPPPNDHLLRCSAVQVEETGGKSFGLVGPQTKIIIRSNASQICLLVNVTSELWSFDEASRRPVFEKVIQYVTQGLGKARTKNHYLTIILAGRLVTESGTSQDLFDILYEGSLNSLDAVLFEKQLRRFFNTYPSVIGWKSNPFWSPEPASNSLPWFLPPASKGDIPGYNYVRDTAVCGCRYSEARITGESMIPTKSVDSNILESINLCISHFNKHHLDRKLKVTGTQITMVTANTGVLHVASPALVNVSKRRFTATACGVRIVSVGPKPVVTRPATLIVGEEKSLIPSPWISFFHFASKFPAGDPLGSPQIDTLSHVAHTVSAENMFGARRSVVKPPGLNPSLTASGSLYSEGYVGKPGLRKPRTDAELIDLGIVCPRLQRVAVEANIRPGDVKPIDNWIVQGEGVKTLHDLIGIRLSLDMQLVDISGTDGGGGVTPPPSAPMSTASVLPGAPTSPSGQSEVSSSMISANAFGVKVHRSSMRDTHIQKVLLKGGEERSMWMLNRLDSGNVYVSKVSLINPVDANSGGDLGQEYMADTYTYEYILRRFDWIRKGSPQSSEQERDLIVCKSCMGMSENISVQTRRFFVSPPMPWNVLDEIISNPYMQQTLPSTVPYNVSPVPPELEGFRWKLRSSVRTGLFCIIPADDAFCHSAPSTGYMLGQDVPLGSYAQSASASKSTSNFLDWLRKVEQILGVSTLAVSIVGEKQKRVAGFVPAMVNRKTDWFQFHYEQQVQLPRPFLFSLEWILCHSAIVEEVILRMEQAASEDSLRMIRLPHAQLFPQPAPGGSSVAECLDQLPFHPKMSIGLPSGTKAGFFNLLLARLTEQLGMILLFSSRDDCVTEGIVIAGSRRVFFSRESSWILMSKSGSFFVEIKLNAVEWFINHTKLWDPVGESAESAEDTFLLLRQAIHMSLIDS